MSRKHFPTFTRLGRAVIQPARRLAGSERWSQPNPERLVIKIVLYLLAVTSGARMILGLLSFLVYGLSNTMFLSPRGMPTGILVELIRWSSVIMGGDPTSGALAPLILAVSLTGLAVLNSGERLVVGYVPSLDRDDPTGPIPKISPQDLVEKPSSSQKGPQAPHPLDPRPDESEPGYPWGQ